MSKLRRSAKESKGADILDHGPMVFAPENELGVVFLFSHLVRRLGLRVERIRPQFPDCIALKKTSGGLKRIRIEFEFRSRNYKSHLKRGRNKCDWIVCWEHNWPAVPSHLQVIELRKFFGLGFNIWIQPVGKQYQEWLETHRRVEHWTLPSRASKGDLLIFHYTHPAACLRQVFLLQGEVKRERHKWKYGGGPLRKVAELDSPVFFKDLKRHPILQTAGFVRGQLQGRPNATEYWPYLYEMILRRNPSLRSKLAKFSPERLAAA